MGKSEIVPMPIHRQESMYAVCKNAYNNNNFLIHPVDESEENDDENPLEIPEGMEVFSHQVAGHDGKDGKSISLIKHQGTILKPITNQKCGDREVDFYEELKSSTDADLIELREFVPNYFGKVTVPINGRDVACIVLEDLSRLYNEPCVMDVKMGKRTWDPMATAAKIAKEESKYQDCKRELSFCIPGFQVYKVHNNQLAKFDKEFGKKLNKDSVKEALKIFLNGESGLCRSLIVQFLACLWRIQLWVRKQRHLEFFSSSLLFLYDARRLRECLKTDSSDSLRPPMKLTRSTSLYRPLSLMVLNQNQVEKVPTGFSGLQTKEGPILKTPPYPNKVKTFESSSFSKNGVIGNNNNNVWQKSFKSLRRTHSFQNDYDKDMQSKRQDYLEMLDELCTEPKCEMWASVKMIDFAHTFHSEHHEIDKNYLTGIDNLIKIFEEFLVESE